MEPCPSRTSAAGSRALSGPAVRAGRDSPPRLGPPGSQHCSRCSETWSNPHQSQAPSESSASRSSSARAPIARGTGRG